MIIVVRHKAYTTARDHFLTSPLTRSPHFCFFFCRPRVCRHFHSLALRSPPHIELDLQVRPPRDLLASHSCSDLPRLLARPRRASLVVHSSPIRHQTHFIAAQLQPTFALQANRSGITQLRRHNQWRPPSTVLLQPMKEDNIPTSCHSIASRFHTLTSMRYTLAANLAACHTSSFYSSEIDCSHRQITNGQAILLLLPEANGGQTRHQSSWFTHCLAALVKHLPCAPNYNSKGIQSEHKGLSTRCSQSLSRHAFCLSQSNSVSVHCRHVK